jgi:hypothetical protein
MTNEPGAVGICGLTHVMNGADVRMIERRDSPRFTFETLAAPGCWAPCGVGNTFSATTRSRRASRARYTHPCPPAANRLAISHTDRIRMPGVSNGRLGDRPAEL